MDTPLSVAAPLRSSGGGIAKKISDLALGNVVAVVVNSVSFLVLTRAYTPSEYGQYGLFLYFAGIFAGCANFCFQMLIPTVRDKAALDGVVGAAAINIGVSALLSLPVGLVYFSLVDFSMWTGSLLLVAYVVAMGVYLLGNALLINEGRNYLSGFLTAGISVFAVVFQLGLWWLGFGWLGLIWGHIAALVAIDVILFAHALSLSPLKAYQLGVGEYFALLQAHRNVWTNNVGQTFVNATSTWLLASGVQVIGGNSAVGIFALCQKLLIVPARVAGAPARQVFLRELSLMDLPAKVASARKYTKVMTAVAVLLMAVVYFSTPLVTVFLPEKWHEVADYAFPLSIWLMMTIAYTPVIGLVNNLNKAHYHRNYELANVAVRAAAVLAFVYVGSTNAAGYVYATSIAAALLIVFFMWYSLAGAEP